MFSVFFEKKNYSKISENVAYIAIGGEGQMKNYLRIWLKIVEYSAINYLVVLDRHAEQSAVNAFRELNANVDNLRILEKQRAEDYYPIEMILDALKKVFSIDIEKKELLVKKKETGGKIDKAIEKILQENDKLSRGWKILLAEHIGNKMGIPKEYDSIVEEIYEQMN